MLVKLIERISTSVSGFAHWLAGPKQQASFLPRRKQNRSDKRFGHFSDRRSRRQNIKNITAGWKQKPGKHRESINRAEPPKNFPLPYLPAVGILTKGERAFWKPLYQALKGKYRIFCKVRLADVICCPSKQPDERRWFRKIANYHVDFVICDPATTRPLLVIELDDRSHRVSEQNRQKRDQWKDEVLRAAKLPVYRLKAQRDYETAELASAINALIAQELD